MISKRITQDFINSRIHSTEFIHDDEDNKYTICILTVENGFKVEGVAHRQFSTTHDIAVAMNSAKEKAIDELWKHYCFLSHFYHNSDLIKE